MYKRLLLFTIPALLLAISLFLTACTAKMAEGQVAKDEDPASVFGLAQLPGSDYNSFLAHISAIPAAKQDIWIPLTALKEGEGSFTIADDSIMIGEDDYLSFSVTVQETAQYELELTSMPGPGRSAACEISVLVNGELQFQQAGAILIDRIWKDASDLIEVDGNGNDIRPKIVEIVEFRHHRCTDSSGYNNSPLRFILNQGPNRVTIHVNRENLLVKEARFRVPEIVPDYTEYQNLHAGAVNAALSAPRIQAEKTAWKNDSILMPTSDRTSPLTQPYKGAKISLNTIGQDGWSMIGQTIAWHVDVPADGLYEIRFKARQNYIRGTYANRTLLIDGILPFAEAQNLRFTFDSQWQLVTFGDKKEPYLIYLTEGRHELALRVTLGNMAVILSQVDSCASEVNSIYRKFLMIMGASPDIMRDYKLDRQLPEVFVQMDSLADRLDYIVNQMSMVTGSKGTELLSLTRMAMNLREFVDKPYYIPAKFGIFTSNISALNAWKNDAAFQPLELDYIEIVAPGKPSEPVRPTLWQSLRHAVAMFIASFSENYDSLGSTLGGSQTITVWSTTGRDQAQVLNQLVKSSFSPDHNINVEIQLVKLDAILPSTVAGNGPDIILYAPQQMPVNFAIRGAAIDLSGFDGFSEVISNFRESALIPASFSGGVYGLPEMETFPMLFFRRDILDEIDVPIPDSWPELLKIIPDLQKNNMSLLLETGIGNNVDNTLGLGTFAMLLYQNGGSFYIGDGIRTTLDSETAIETFKAWCRLYTNYGLPTNFNAAYRFRTGESPLVIADMSLYNTLTISAPEIKGLWGMTTVPGTLRGAVIDKSVKSNTTYTMMTRTCDQPEAAWEFVRWWLSEETQLTYARDLESLMGAAARYMTANVNAFARLPWSTKDLKAILEQSGWTVGVPEVAGSYFLPRHINNAFRSVVINKVDPREALITYAKVINAELREKRLEFGLPVTVY